MTKTFAKLSSTDYLRALTDEPIDPRLFTEQNDPAVCRDLTRTFLSVVNLGTTSYCNRTCSYCPISMVEEQPKLAIGEDILESVIASLRSIEFQGRVSLNMYNEPLADDAIFGIVRRLRAALPGTRLSFNSNGDYLSREALDELAACGLQDLYVTLHPQKDKPYDDADRVAHLIRFFVRLGLPTAVRTFIPGQRVETHLTSKGLNLEVFCTNWGQQGIGNSRGGLMEQLAVKHIRDYPCERPFREMAVHFNGDVYPCCEFFPQLHHDTYPPAGNITRDDLLSIYCNETFSSYRRGLFRFSPKNGLCGQCFVGRGLFPQALAERHDDRARELADGFGIVLG